VAVVDDHVQLPAPSAVSVNHEPSRDLVALGQEEAKALRPGGLGGVSLHARVIEGLAASLEIEIKLLLLEQQERAKVDLPGLVDVVRLDHGVKVSERARAPPASSGPRPHVCSRS
jgi:hypothetical protein